jgi:hypothetical protein
MISELDDCSPFERGGRRGRREGKREEEGDGEGREKRK